MSNFQTASDLVSSELAYNPLRDATDEYVDTVRAARILAPLQSRRLTRAQRYAVHARLNACDAIIDRCTLRDSFDPSRAARLLQGE